MLSNLSSIIKNNCFIFEQNCVLCGESKSALCASCEAALPLLQQPTCAHCAEPLLAPGICSDCQQTPPAFDKLYAPYRFDYPLSGLISAFKYGKQLGLSSVLGRLMQTFATTQVFDQYHIVIPIPLSKERLATRGFNQSEELARAISGIIGGRLSTHLCWRKYNTLTQATLQRAERLKNLEDAFGVKHSCKGLNIAIIDDVATTGATLSALAKPLKKAGAKRVDAWVLARTFSCKT